MKKQRWTTGKNQSISRRATMKLAYFWLRNDKRLLQTGKIDKVIIFWLIQGKSGCVSLPPRFCHLYYGMEWPFWTTVIKAAMLGMVYLDLTARPYCWGSYWMQIDKQEVCKSAWLTNCIFTKVQNWKTASLQNVTLKKCKDGWPFWATVCKSSRLGRRRGFFFFGWPFCEDIWSLICYTALLQ